MPIIRGYTNMSKAKRRNTNKNKINKNLVTQRKREQKKKVFE